MRIGLSLPDVGKAELELVQDAVTSGWVTPLGPHLDAFEQELADFTGGNHVVGLSSGTAALHLALILAGVTAGDTVLVSSFTFAASANPVVYLGAQPVFIGSEDTTWNMCPDSLEAALTALRKQNIFPKALIVVHLYGMPACMAEILEIAQRFDVEVIEDAAESLGASTNLAMTGTHANFGILSFNGNKLITTSSGGALICRQTADAQRARYLATQARQPVPYYEHTDIGYNYRLSNVCAAIGRGQLQTIKQRIEKRREHFAFYQERLANLPLSFQPEPSNFFANRWLSTVLFDQNAENSEISETVRLKLLEHQIESRPLWKPMHLQPVYRSCSYFGSGLEEHLFNHGLCLPSGNSLTNSEREEICDVIEAVF
jgi:dTDP-4-amino-4,6-dideoxygalactose transaminase